MNSNEKPLALLYTVEEVSKLLGIPRNAAYAAVRRGDVPVIRIGKLIRSPKEAFHAKFGGQPT